VPRRSVYGLCERYEARSLVDEDHATAIAGRVGRALVSPRGVERAVDADAFGKGVRDLPTVCVRRSPDGQLLINRAR
jgi:7-keto-8-aminopelargonate synthetase-like enzyme